MQSKETCLKLLAAESEAIVREIIAVDDVFSNPGNWKPLDDRETNFNVTSNQASDGGKALTELMTNMVDAVLMKKARLEGVDPKGPEAPRTMYEAVDRFVKNLYGGKLVNLDPKDSWLRDFSQKNLVIGITGARTKKQGLPCYTFVDNGEGQRPEDFESTFLSLSVGNKKNIPFVQGKYNMGSSGVLRYCGRNWYKLIISRRYDRKCGWGWTLIRRRPSNVDELPIAEYFVLPDGTIPSFEPDVLYPFKTTTGKRHDGVYVSTGTVVKLYDYQVGSRFVSFKGSREALNENLVETILPFRLLDFRQLPTTTKGRKAAAERGGERALGIDARPFYGMEFLLMWSHREEGLVDDEEDVAAGESRVEVGKIVDPDLGEITISAIVLKALPGWLDDRQRINRVFHAVNGQVQFKQTRGYLTTCKLPALKDRVVVVVDASRLSFYAHNEVWKGDREHITNTLLGERYKDVVTETIRESPALKDLQNKIAKQELERATNAESNSLFQKLVDADRNLAVLLSDRDPVVRLPASGGTNGSDRGKGEFKAKFSPTFVRFEEKFHGGGVDIPINKSRPIAALTDAENGYFGRPDNRGHLLLPEEVRTRFAVREHLHTGRLTLYMEPMEGKLSIGDTVRLKLGLKDDAMPTAVETREIEIRIDDEAAPPLSPGEKSRKRKPRRSGEGNGREGGGQDAPTHGLPICYLLTKDGRKVEGYTVERWPEGFNETDGGVIADLGGNEVIYKINYDNTYHLNYRTQQHGQIAKDAVTEKYILGMRILMLGFEHAFRSAKPENGVDRSVEEFADEFRRMAARGAASTVLALAENLPKIFDKSAIEQGDE